MTDAHPLVALRPVVDALEGLGVAYYVGGSLASSAHGVARASLDVDVVAALRPDHVADFVARLAPAYYLDEARIRHAVDHRRSFNLIHLDSMFKVDVFVAKDRQFDRDALARAQERLLDTAPGTRTVRVASAEDVLLAKLEWFRAGGETSQRQWTDVLGVLKMVGGALDRAYLVRGGHDLGVSDLLERASREAES